MRIDFFLGVIASIVAAILFALLSWVTGLRRDGKFSHLQIWGGISATATLVIVAVIVLVFFGPMRVEGIYAVVQDLATPTSTRPIEPSLIFRPDSVLPVTALPAHTSTIPVLVEESIDTPTVTTTPTESPTVTPTDTTTATPTWTSTATTAPTDTPSPTPSNTPTATSTPTALPRVEIIWRDSACDRPGQKASIRSIRIESEQLVLYGIADRPDFTSYIIYWGTGADLEKPIEERLPYFFFERVAESDVLQRIPLARLQKAIYQVTLRVMKPDGNYDSCEVSVIHR